MPGERSAASMGRLENRVLRAVVVTPLPAPLSKAVALGAESGDSPWTNDIKPSAQRRVTYSALAAYAFEAVPQPSDDDKWDMDSGLCGYEISLDVLEKVVGPMNGKRA